MCVLREKLTDKNVRGDPPGCAQSLYITDDGIVNYRYIHVFSETMFCEQIAKYIYIFIYICTHAKKSICGHTGT
jgi:hypothetical protein